MAGKSLVDILHEEAKEITTPNAAFEMVQPDLDRAKIKFLELYVGGKTEEAKLEERFAKVAEHYITALYGSMGISPTIKAKPEMYAQTIRDWAAKAGEDHFAKIRQAIKIGNAVKVLDLLNDAYQAQAQGSKSTSHVSKVQSQDADTQLALNKLTAKALGGKNYARVGANYPGSLQNLAEFQARQAIYN